MEATDGLVQTHQDLEGKREETEVWAGVTKKAEVFAWQKLACSGFMYFTLFSVTLPEIGKQSVLQVSKIKIF